MTSLSFNKVDLLFNIDINNPNSAGINLSGFDYNLKLEDKSFINGEQDGGLAIKPNGSEIIKLPLSLNYVDIFNTFSEIKNLDSVKYNLQSGLTFSMPVLGNIRIPVSKTGSIPNLKLPSISLKNLQMENLKFTGADLILKIKLDNPNVISFLLKNLDYQLSVAGTQWIKGSTSKTMSVNAKDESIIDVPISLNFLNMGQSLYQILQGDQTLNYNLNGNAKLGSSLTILGDFDIPFNQSAETKILK
jgi:LEA14-like dessication related protein